MTCAFIDNVVIDFFFNFSESYTTRGLSSQPPQTGLIRKIMWTIFPFFFLRTTTCHSESWPMSPYVDFVYPLIRVIIGQCWNDLRNLDCYSIVEDGWKKRVPSSCYDRFGFKYFNTFKNWSDREILWIFNLLISVSEKITLFNAKRIVSVTVRELNYYLFLFNCKEKVINLGHH